MSDKPGILAARRLRELDSAAAPFWAAAQPLLPSRVAKLVLCGRAVIVMGLLSLFVLSPDTRSLLQNAVLVPIAGVICIQSSLGATIVTAWRILVAGVVSSIYTCIVLAVLPPSPVAAVATTTVATFVVSYLDVSVTCKRFILAGVVIPLLQWWDPTKGVTFVYSLDVCLSLILGAAVGVIAALIPAPIIATATHEAASRARLMYGTLRSQLAPLALSFTHKNVPRVRSVDIPQFSASALFPERSAGGAASSTGPASLPATSRHFGKSDMLPLLRAEVDDFGISAALQLELLAKALSEIKEEPSSWFLRLPSLCRRAYRVWMTAFHACFCCKSPARFDGCSGHERSSVAILPDYHSRLSLWGVASRKLQRILQAMAVAERQISASDTREVYLSHLEDPVCDLVGRTLRLHELSLSWSARVRWSFCCGSSTPYGESVDSKCMSIGFPGERRVALHEIFGARRDLNAALTAFLVSFQRTRMYLVSARVAISRQEVGNGAGGCTTGSLWHISDLFALNAFLFFLLRYTQTVLSTVDAVCPPEFQSTAPYLQTSANLGPQQIPARTPAASLTSNVRPCCRCTCARVSFRVAATVSVCWSCACTAVFTLTSFLRWYGAFIGVSLTARQAKRALRISVAICAASIAGITLQQQVFTEGGFGYWGSVTVAFITGGGVDAATFGVITQRIVGTLVGAACALFVVRLAQGSNVAVGVMITLFVAVMQYPRSQGSRGYWALVAAFTAAIVSFGSTGSVSNADNLLELRVLYTLLGILIYVVAAQLVFPVSARRLAHHSLVSALRTLRQAQHDTFVEFSAVICSEANWLRQHLSATSSVGSAFVVTSVSVSSAATVPPLASPFPTADASDDSPIEFGLTVGADAGDGTLQDSADAPSRERPMPPLPSVFAGSTSCDPTHQLQTVDTAVASLSELMAEAAAEPAWGVPFYRIQPHYGALAQQISVIARNVRSLYQCVLSLRAQAQVFLLRNSATHRQQGAAIVVQISEGVQQSSRDGAGLPLRLHQLGSPPGRQAGGVGENDSTAALDAGEFSGRGALIFSSLLPQIVKLVGSIDRVYALSEVVLADAAALPSLLAALAPLEQPAPADTPRTETPRTDTPRTETPLQQIPQASSRLQCMELLPAAVEDMATRVHDYMDTFDEFVIRGSSEASAGCAASAEPSQAVAGGPVSSQPLLLSNVDSLCYTTASFALQQIASAASEVAALSRCICNVQVAAGTARVFGFQ